MRAPVVLPLLALSLSTFLPGADQIVLGPVGSGREEQRLLQAAPHGARRLGRHRLQVGWSGGTTVFRDEPPCDGLPVGRVWTYCGYNRELRLHLLHKDEDTTGTGALLDDATGRLLPAGETVIFSPDRRQYLAYEQPDGLDGSAITLYRRDGRRLWTGYAGILSSSHTIVASFDPIRWNARGQMVAEATGPGAEKAGTYTLAQRKDGQWAWIRNR
jgi:hypothetical protein